MRDGRGRGRAQTIDGKIAQCRTGSSLDLNIGALEQEKDGLQCISVDLTDICSEGRSLIRSSRHIQSTARTSFRNLCEGQARTALQIDIVGVDQGAQSSQWLSGEEISFVALRR